MIDQRVGRKHETVRLRNAALVRAKESVELMRPSEPCLMWTALMTPADTHVLVYSLEQAEQAIGIYNVAPYTFTPMDIGMFHGIIENRYPEFFRKFCHKFHQTQNITKTAAA